MTEPNGQTSQQTAAWQVELFRLSLFLSPTTETETALSWESLVGESPASLESQPRLGIQQESGPYNAGVLTLVQQPQRVDCVFSALEQKENSFGYIGPLRETLQSFTEISLRALAKSPRLIRLAFGAVLLQPAESRTAGYRQLAPLLPAVTLDPDNMSDFMYRINRRRSSKILDKLDLNRLSSWSVAALLQAQFPFGGQATVKEYAFASRIELDINTVPDYKADLPQDKLGDLFRELSEYALEIAEQGDRP